MQKRVEVGVDMPLELRPLKDRHALAAATAGRLEPTMRRHAGHRAAAADHRQQLHDGVGETVVVGTSRLGGDKALIALVTAVKKTATSKSN